jgi:hypothetical protein
VRRSDRRPESVNDDDGDGGDDEDDGDAAGIIDDAGNDGDDDGAATDEDPISAPFTDYDSGGVSDEEPAPPSPASPHSQYLWVMSRPKPTYQRRLAPF